MPIRLRGTGVEFDNGVQEIGEDPPIWAGRTNDSNVRNTYNNFPLGTKVAHWDTRNRNTGFAGNGSTNFTEDWRRVWKKVGPNNWDEVGG